MVRLSFENVDDGEEGVGEFGGSGEVWWHDC